MTKSPKPAVRGKERVLSMDDPVGMERTQRTKQGEEDAALGLKKKGKVPHDGCDYWRPIQVQ
jgi:hypothetical protein